MKPIPEWMSKDLAYEYGWARGMFFGLLVGVALAIVSTVFMGPSIGAEAVGGWRCTAEVSAFVFDKAIERLRGDR